MRFIFLLLTCLSWSHALLAQSWSAKVVHVTDGDTIWVRKTPTEPAIKVRIYGIDAPELCQPYGQEARIHLTDWILHKTVELDSHGLDPYQRTLADIRYSNTDVGLAMVTQGYAWSYYHNRRQAQAGYLEAENNARSSRLGLWQEAHPEQPVVYRHEPHPECKESFGPRTTNTPSTSPLIGEPLQSPAFVESAAAYSAINTNTLSQTPTQAKRHRKSSSSRTPRKHSSPHSSHHTHKTQKPKD